MLLSWVCRFHRLVSSSDVGTDKSELIFNQNDVLTKVDVDYEDELTITNKRLKYASFNVCVPESNHFVMKSVPKKFDLRKVPILFYLFMFLLYLKKSLFLGGENNDHNTDQSVLFDHCFGDNKYKYKR